MIRATTSGSENRTRMAMRSAMPSWKAVTSRSGPSRAKPRHGGVADFVCDHVVGKRCEDALSRRLPRLAAACSTVKYPKRPRKLLQEVSVPIVRACGRSFRPQASRMVGPDRARRLPARAWTPRRPSVGVSEVPLRRWEPWVIRTSGELRSSGGSHCWVLMSKSTTSTSRPAGPGVTKLIGHAGDDRVVEAVEHRVEWKDPQDAAPSRAHL